MTDDRPLWEHQQYGIDAVFEARARKVEAVCLTSPTGSGKSRTTFEIARRILDDSNRVALYTNRRMMIDQFSEALLDAGQYHGTRARGHADEREHPLQICSIQTEHARCVRSNKWELHACRPGDIAIFDEGHLHVNQMANEIRRRHREGGAMTLDITATPLGMDEVCQELIIAGTVPQLIERGIIVPSHTYGPDEPDIRSFKKLQKKIEAGGDVSENDARQAIMAPGIMGRVHRWYMELNPEQKPTLLFAPGVNESVWFAQQCCRVGIKAAHIDGDDIWLDGKLYRSTTKGREEILQAHKARDIKVICNRFVLREAVDMPWVEHIILGTMFSNIGNYIQTAGRGGRRDPDNPLKTYYTVQDHGGNWLRFGSLNADRKWKLEYTNTIMTAARIERIRRKEEREPRRCPKCAAIMTTSHCRCGYEFERAKEPRPVVSTDGTLKLITRDSFEPRRMSKPSNMGRWKSMYWRARQEGWNATFRQAMAKFAEENYWGWPGNDWLFMPVEIEDTFRRVVDVPFAKLHGYCPRCDRVGCECTQPAAPRKPSLFF